MLGTCMSEQTAVYRLPFSRICMWHDRSALSPLVDLPSSVNVRNVLASASLRRPFSSAGPSPTRLHCPLALT